MKPFFLFIGVLALIAGCRSGQPEIAKVHGKVALNGKPLSIGKVTFIPLKGRTATGLIQSDGTYTLTTYIEGDGASLGSHRVTIESREKKPFKGIENDEPPGKSFIPENYSIESSSGLVFDVKPGLNQADFNLLGP